MTNGRSIYLDCVIERNKKKTVTSPTTDDKILVVTKWAKRLIVRFEVFVVLSIATVWVIKQFYPIDISMGAIWYLLEALVLVYIAFAIIEAWVLRKYREDDDCL